MLRIVPQNSFISLTPALVGYKEETKETFKRKLWWRWDFQLFVLTNDSDNCQLPVSKWVWSSKKKFHFGLSWPWNASLLTGLASVGRGNATKISDNNSLFNLSAKIDIGPLNNLKIGHLDKEAPEFSDCIVKWPCILRPANTTLVLSSSY